MCALRHWILVPVLALPLAGCGGAEQTSDALDTRAFGPEVRRQIDEAYRAALEAPDDAELQGRLGMTLHAYQQYNPAADAYRLAAELDPEVFRWRYYLARAVGAAGRSSEALALMNTAVELRPEYSPALVSLGDLLMEAGDLETALENYTRAVELDEQSARARYGLAKVLRAVGDDLAALESFRETLRLSPSFGAAHHAIGMLYRDLGESELAAEHLELGAKHRTVRARARDTLMVAISSLLSGAGDLTKVAVEMFGNGNTEGALTKLREAVELDPEFVPARVNLVKILGDLGRYEEAESHYEAAIATTPNAQQARFNYARMLIQQTRLREAQTELETVVGINPHLADAQVLLGSLFEENGHLPEARARYELAVASKPAHPQANLMLVKHRLAAGDLASADEHAQRLLEADTKSLPILAYRLGLFYEQAGQRTRAIEILRWTRNQAEAAGRERLVQEIDGRLEAWG